MHRFHFHSTIFLLYLFFVPIFSQSEFRVSTNWQGDQEEPAIATFPSGNYIVSWTTATTGCSKEIAVRVISSTGQLVNEINPVDTICAYDQQYSDVAALSDTTYVVVWQSEGAQDGSGYGVYRRICNTTGSCSDASEVVVSQTTAGNQTVPKVAQIANSTFHVVVWYHSGTFFAIYARIFDSVTGAATSSGELLVQIAYTAGNLGAPDVDGGITPNGYRFFVTWQADEGVTSGLTVRTTIGYLNGTVGNTTWTDVPNDVSLDQKNPCIAYLSGGDKVIIGWESGNTNFLDTYYRMMNSNRVFSANQVALSTAIADQQDITCAWSANGNFIFAYTSNQNTSDIYYKVFSSSAAQIGSETLANDYTSFEQTQSSVAGGTNGQFLVVYKTQSSPLDGGGSGVLGKFIETSLYYSGVPASKAFTWTEDTPFYFNSTGILGVYPFYKPAIVNVTVQIMTPIAASFNTPTGSGLTVSPSLISIFSSTIENVNSILNQIVITPALNYNSDYVLRMTISDVPLFSSFSVDLNMLAVPVNDPPQWISNTLAIAEGGSANLTTGNVVVTDVDSVVGQIQFSLTNITHGNFYIGATEITSFTYSDLNNGAVIFIHDGSDFAPTYTVSAFDGQNSASSDAVVSFTAVNDPPVLVNNSFVIQEGVLFRVSSTNIGISDDSSSDQITISVLNSVAGNFVDRDSIAITSFTQTNLISGHVFYQHDGGEQAPSFSISVTDGEYSVGPYNPTINFTNINDAPTLTLQQITLLQDQTLVLTTAHINVTDPDSGLTSITFQVGQHQFLQVIDCRTNHSMISFTYSELTSQYVAIQQNGGNNTPTLALSASDGQDSSPNTTFVINFVAASPSPAPENNNSKKSDNTAIIAGAVGGAGGLIALVLVVSVLVLKKKKNKAPKDDNTLETHPSNEHTTNYRAIEMSSVPQMNVAPEKKTEDAFSIKYSELEIGKELGRGAFGIVYKAEWRNGDCVVKQLDIDGTDNNAVQQFLKEADILKSLRMHPNVCSLLGVCTDPKYPVCIVMEYVPGGSLFDYLAKGKLKVDAKNAVQLFKDISSGMAHIHQEGLLHCDLATRNLLIAPRGNDDVTVKIADFGLAKSTESGIYNLGSNAKFPIRWTAPEVFQTGKMTKATDVWSFGVVMWEILEQKIPYYDLSNQDIAEAICNKGVRLPKPTKTECPDDLYAIMLSCFDANPDKRPSFDDLVHSFKGLEKKWGSDSGTPKIPAHVETGYSSMASQEPTAYSKRGTSESVYHN